MNGDTLAGSLATGATATSGVGAYAIAQGSLAASANYQVTYTGATLLVTPRPLTITADNQSRSAGQPNPTLTFTVGGRGPVNGDALTGALATAAAPSSPPGAYAIAQGSLVATPNYQVTCKPGALTVGFARTAPYGFLAGSQERDAFAVDTLPSPDQARLTIATTGSTTVLDKREASRRTDICPKEKPCTRPR